MESILVCAGLVDIQLTQADSRGDCLSIPPFSRTPSAHLIKLPINSIKRVGKHRKHLAKFWPAKPEPKPIRAPVALAEASVVTAD